MKKIISWIMLVAMILGMFAGCGKAADPTQPATTAPSEIPEVTVVTENNALDVINYLQFIYKDSGAKTSGNFDRFGIVRIAGVPYTVEWTVDVGEDKVKIIVNDDGTVTIDVNEKCTEDTVYTLTATITDANGNTETASWEYLLPGVASLEEMHAIIDQAYSLEVGEALTEEVTLTGVISTIDTPYSDQYKNITVTIIIEGREDKPIMCYRLKGEGAAELNPGDTISVQGIIKNYNNKIEFDAGCQLTTVEKTGKAVEIPSDPHEILNDVYALGENESLPYGPVTMTGRICSIDTPWSEQYKNITVSIIIDWYTIKCYRLKGEGAENLEMNDIITVKGYIKKYNGTREFDVPELLDVVKVGEYPQPADQLHVAKVAYNLDPGWTVPYGDVTLTGTITKGGTWSEQYKNITVTMVVDGDDKGEYPIECYRMTIPEDASKELQAAIKTLDVGDKITVKGILMKYQNAKSGATKVEFNVPELVKVVKAPKVESGLTATLTTTLKTGDKVVIVAPTQKIAMSSVIVNSYYPKGVAVTIDGDKISGFNATEVMTVTVNSDGSYTFSYDGKNLGMASSYSSMYFGNPNDDWTLAQVSSGVYNVKNTVRGNYMQFATNYSTWQTSSSVPTDKSGNLSFYKLEGDLPGDEGGSDSGSASGATLLTSKPADGDVIAIVNSGKAMTATASGKKLAAETASITDGKLTLTDKTAQLTVSIDANGYYTFTTADGKYLTSGATGNSLSLAASASQYSLWTVESAGNNKWYIKNVNAKYNGNVQSMEYYSGFTTYGHKNTAIYQMELYQVATKPSGAPLMTTAPADGNVIAIVNSGKAMTSTASGKKLAAETASITDGYLTATEKTAQLKVSIDANGYYTFTTPDGKYLTSGATGNSLSLAASASQYSLWTVESAGNNKWYIKNVNAKYNGNVQSMEYYSGFTTYGHKNTAIYQMELYLISGGSGSVTPPVTPPAEPEIPAASNIYMKDAPKDGDKVVIVAHAFNKALSTSYNGYYNNGSSVSISGDKLTYAATDVWTVTVNADGTYTFATSAGKKISLDASYNSMPLDKVNDKWKLTSVSDRVFNIENAGRTGFVMKFQSDYGTWSTYNYDDPKTNTQYHLSFYLVEAGTVTPPVTPDPEPDTPVTPPVTGESSYVKVESAADFTTGKYVMVVSGGYAPKSYSSNWVLSGKPTVGDGVITTDNAAGYIWDITVNGSSAVLTDGNGVTIKPKAGNNNGIQTGSYNWAWAFNGGTFTFAGTGSDTSKLACNTGDSSQRFRAYKNSTISGYASTYPCNFTLYKLTEAAAEPELKVSTIKEALAAATGTELKITGYVNMVVGSKVYVQDATGAICVEMASSGAKKGDTFTFTGTKAAGSVLTGTAAEAATPALSQFVTECPLYNVATEVHLYHYMNITSELTVIGEEGDYIIVADDEDNQIKIFDPICADPSKLVENAVISFKGVMIGEDNGYMVFQNADAADITIVKEAPTQPGAGEEGGSTQPVTKVYTIADYDISSTAGKITCTMDDTLTISVGNGLKNNNLLRVYANQMFTFSSSKEISSIVLKASYKNSTFYVETSDDGSTWTRVLSNVAFTSAEADVTITLNTPAKYVRIVPAAQMRVRTITVSYI